MGTDFLVDMEMESSVEKIENRKQRFTDSLKSLSLGEKMLKISQTRGWWKMMELPVSDGQGNRMVLSDSQALSQSVLRRIAETMDTQYFPKFDIITWVYWDLEGNKTPYESVQALVQECGEKVGMCLFYSEPNPNQSGLSPFSSQIARGIWGVGESKVWVNPYLPQYPMQGSCSK